MAHPDDAALPIDQTVIDRVLDAAAPEKAARWRDHCVAYGVTFHLVNDRKGVTMRARGLRVEFDHKTMLWLWILAFAGWEAVRLHGPLFFYAAATGVAVDGQLRAADPGFGAAEGDYETALYVVRHFPAVETIDETWNWPAGIPAVQADKQGFNDEQEAAFDLCLISTAFMLLHEVRHIIFTAHGERPSPPQEEMHCDAFARAFLLDGIDEYVARSKEDRERVVAKRAAGIALGLYILHEFTPENERAGTADYPPIADRVAPLFDEVHLPPGSWFWSFAAALLAGSLFRRNREATLPSLTDGALCKALVELLRDEG